MYGNSPYLSIAAKQKVVCRPCEMRRWKPRKSGTCASKSTNRPAWIMQGGLGARSCKRPPKVDNLPCTVNRYRDGGSCLSCQCRYHTQAPSNAPADADELSIARKTLLSGQMACSGCNEEKGSHCSAHGQRTRVSCLASRYHLIHVNVS